MRRSADTYWTVSCFIQRGKKKVERRAQIGAASKEAAIARMKRSYPPPRYFGWKCDNSDKP